MKKKKRPLFKSLSILPLLSVLAISALYGGFKAGHLIDTRLKKEAAELDKAKREAHQEAVLSLTMSFTDAPLVYEYDPAGEPLKTADFIKEYHGELETEGPETIYLNTVGKYDLRYTLRTTDEYDQDAYITINRSYEVKDTQAPVIELLADDTAIFEGESFDPASYIKRVYDPADGDLPYSEDPVVGYGRYSITTDLNTAVPGDYTVTVNAEDINHNTSSASYTVRVMQKTPEPAEGAIGNSGKLFPFADYGGQRAAKNAAESWAFNQQFLRFWRRSSEMPSWASGYRIIEVMYTDGVVRAYSVEWTQ